VTTFDQPIVYVSTAKKVLADRKGASTYLSQGAAGGACAAFVYLGVITAFSTSRDGYWLAMYFPFLAFLCGFFGTLAGLFIWFAAEILGRKPGILTRVTIATIIISLVPLLFSLMIVAQNMPLEVLVGPLVFGLAIGIPVGIFTGTRIRPGHLIAYGIQAQPTAEEVVFSGGPIRISQQIDQMKFAFLSGLMLRFVSLLGLMTSLIALGWAIPHLYRYLPDIYNAPEFTVPIITTCYFFATVYISYATLPKWLVLTLSVSVNALLSTWIDFTVDIQANYYFVVIAGSISIGIWLLFVIGRMWLEKKGPPLVEYGHTEIRFGKAQWVKEAI